MSLKQNLADNRKPLNMSAEMWALEKKLNRATTQEQKDDIQKQMTTLDHEELEQAEQNLALSEFGYKKW